MSIELVQRLDFLRSAAAGRHVLHLGCADSPYTDDAIRNGTLLHRVLAEAAAEIYGFDYDEAGLSKLRELGFDNLYFADLERLEDVPTDKTFDVIIAGEMIEHLNNPGLFLQGIKRFLKPDGQLVITTINAYGAMRFFRYSMTRGGGVNEPVHPDHVAYYSYSTLNLLLKRHNLDVTRFLFYDLGTDHRKTTPFIFKFLNDAGVRFSRQLADGVIAVCRLSQAAE